MKDFDKLLEEENVSLNIEKQIKRKMNKSIYTRVLVLLISIALIVVGVYKGSNLIQSEVYYNPNNEEQFLVDDVKGNEFKVLFQTFLGLIHPGQSCWFFDDIEDLGNGKYSFAVKVFDSFYSSNYDWQTNMTFGIEKSKLKINTNASSERLLVIADEFVEPGKTSSTYSDNLDYIYKEVQALPDSGYINASISFKEYKTLDEVVSYMETYNDVAFKWLALKGMNLDSQIAGGMTLYESSYWDLSENTIKEYPYFYIWKNEQRNADTLKQNYLSKLKILLDHKDFVKVMENEFGGLLDYETIQSHYDKAQNEMLAYGFRINIKKADFLKILENEDISMARVHDVKLSRLSK